MNPHAEGDMIAQVPIQTEFVGLRKLRRIAVSCSIIDGDGRPFGQMHTGHLDVTRRVTRQSLNRTLETKRFFNDGIDETAILAQLSLRLSGRRVAPAEQPPEEHGKPEPIAQADQPGSRACFRSD